MRKHDEFFDEALVGLGVKFTDETAPMEMPKMERKSDVKEDNPSVCPSGSQLSAGHSFQSPLHKGAREAVDAKYVPVPKGGTGDPSPTERLNRCVRGVGPLAIISGVLFWWQQAGLLDPKAAWPSFIVIALLAGLEIGRYALRGGNT